MKIIGETIVKFIWIMKQQVVWFHTFKENLRKAVAGAIRCQFVLGETY
jgi:hypothetical protein